MDKIIIFFLLISIAVALIGVLKTLEENKRYTKSSSRTYTRTILQPNYVPVGYNYSGLYKKCNLLTQNEHQAWMKLRDFADENGLYVCAKVRLLDLVEPKKQSGKNYMTLFHKVQAKHVDFVICDENLNVKLIIELDDYTHNRPDRIERDIFVNQVLSSVGYKLIRIRYIDDEELDLIASLIPGTYWSYHDDETIDDEVMEYLEQMEADM